jgi:allophanate hydrolase subunit 2
LFAGRGLKQFFSQTFTVSNQSDRMGIRLEGEPVVCDGSVDIISDGIALGSVQVPASGQPIILLADRQTTGGYAKIATVITTDIPLLAQCRPGDALCFNSITVKKAQDIRVKEQREYHRWYKKWR